MADIPKIVLPHGGYKKLIVYRKSDAIYQARSCSATDSFPRTVIAPSTR